MSQIDRVVIDAVNRLNYPIEVHQLEMVLENELNKVCECSSVELSERETIERNLISDWNAIWLKKSDC
jgi:hypothetical protein